MSGLPACRCKPRDVEVMVRYGSNSAFAGYRWVPSEYSQVRCRKCGAIWRTKAAYVATAPNAAPPGTSFNLGGREG